MKFLITFSILILSTGSYASECKEISQAVKKCEAVYNEYIVDASPCMVKNGGLFNSERVGTFAISVVQLKTVWLENSSGTIVEGSLQKMTGIKRKSYTSASTPYDDRALEFCEAFRAEAVLSLATEEEVKKAIDDFLHH